MEIITMLFVGKPENNGPCSMAMWNNQMVFSKGLNGSMDYTIAVLFFREIVKRLLMFNGEVSSVDCT